MLKEGVHSGASGIIPSTFRIMRQLLDRLEDAKTGDIVQDFQTTIPDSVIGQPKITGKVISDAIVDNQPWVESTVRNCRSRRFTNNW